MMNEPTVWIPQATSRGGRECKVNGIFDSTYPSSKNRRGRVQGEYGEITPALTSAGITGLNLITDIEMKVKENNETQNYTKDAIQASKEGLYEHFLDELKSKATEVIVGAYRRFLKKPEGRGWVFDFVKTRWFRIRNLTPRECFRLMDVPENYIDRIMAKRVNPKTGKEEQIISNSQLYKMAGNSICVAPMALTFEQMLFPDEVEYAELEQLTLF